MEAAAPVIAYTSTRCDHAIVPAELAFVIPWINEWTPLLTCGIGDEPLELFCYPWISGGDIRAELRMSKRDSRYRTKSFEIEQRTFILWIKAASDGGEQQIELWHRGHVVSAPANDHGAVIDSLDRVILSFYRGRGGWEFDKRCAARAAELMPQGSQLRS